MPECTSCDRYFAPNAVLTDGTCPKCGEQVMTVTPTREQVKIPWHFWLVLAGVVAYLGWRVIQFVVWIFQSSF